MTTLSSFLRQQRKQICRSPRSIQISLRRSPTRQKLPCSMAAAVAGTAAAAIAAAVAATAIAAVAITAAAAIAAAAAAGAAATAFAAADDEAAAAFVVAAAAEAAAALVAVAAAEADVPASLCPKRQKLQPRLAASLAY